MIEKEVRMQNTSLNIIKLPLSGVLLVSDMDGTLVTGNFTIPQRNLEAIERFKQKGGTFAIATGRANTSVEKFNSILNLTTPAILYNGSAIYDLEKHEFILSKYLPESARILVKQAIKLFPEIGVEVLGDGRIYVVNSNIWTERHTSNESVEYDITHADSIKVGWNKVLFAGEYSRLQELCKYTESYINDGWDFVFSDPKYYEMLPAGVSKGSSLKILAEMLKISHNNVMAIGDYFNDLTMIKEAAVGAAPAGAPSEIKEQADIVVGSCEDGAVADFIEYIEEKYNIQNNI
jgi:Cof subfamily protein (haloacid dehalogenase superfamily)